MGAGRRRRRAAGGCRVRLTCAVAAHPGPACAACTAGAALVPVAYERPDESGCLRNRQLWHRSQCQNTCCYKGNGNRQHRARAQPRWVPPLTQAAGPRYPQVLAHRAAHPLQPHGHSQQPAPHTTGPGGVPGHRPGDEQRTRRGQPGADPLQAIVSRLYGVGGCPQRAAQHLLKVTIALGHFWSPADGAAMTWPGQCGS